MEFLSVYHNISSSLPRNLKFNTHVSAHVCWISSYRVFKAETKTFGLIGSNHIEQNNNRKTLIRTTLLYECLFKSRMLTLRLWTLSRLRKRGAWLWPVPATLGEAKVKLTRIHNFLPSRWRMCDPVQDLGADGEQQHPEGGVDLYPAYISEQVVHQVQQQNMNK